MNWETFKTPLVIAHRGFTQKALENTLPAIEAALALGVDGIEVDLKITRDEEVIVFHDDTLQRLAGDPRRVSDLSLSSLRKIFKERTRTDLPTLQDLLDLVKDKALLNLELKSSFLRGNLEKKTAQLLKHFPFPERLLMSSFYLSSLWRIKKWAPQLARGYLFEKYLPLHERLIPFVAPISLNLPLAYVSKELAERQHQENRRLFVWTVNSENDMKRCIETGVDGIITDRPDVLLSYLHGRNSHHRS